MSGGDGKALAMGRAWLRTLGPVFGLGVVLVLFVALLGLKDVMDQRESVSGSGWAEAARASDYAGLKAFIGVTNQKTVLAQTVIVSVGGLGMAMIIISGGIDLSVGSVVALTSVLGAVASVRGWSPVMVVVSTLLAGGCFGAVNGAMIAGFRMMPFVVTLGMMGVARGLAKWLGNNQTVNVPPESPINGLMKMEDLDHFFPLPAGVWIVIGLSVFLTLILNRSVFGRRVFAIGSNEATARLCGIQVGWHKVLIYAFAGLFFGCAGLMQMTRLTQGDPSGAVGLELDMIAAVVIGGASLSGGTGSVVGTMVGALVIQTLRNGSSLMAWPNYTQEIIIGAVIILAVGLDRWRQSRRAI